MLGYKVRLNAFFRNLIKKGILSESPLDRIVYNRHPRPRQKRWILSQKELEDLSKKAKNYSPGYFYPLFQTFVETAAKSSEILRLTWDQVNFKKGVIILTEDQDVLQARVLPVSKSLLDALSKMRPVSDHVFPSLGGKPMSKRQLSIQLLNFKKYYQIKDAWSYLDLRHSYAYQFLSQGGDMRRLKAILGHRSFQVTEELYGNYKAKSLDVDFFYER